VREGGLAGLAIIWYGDHMTTGELSVAVAGACREYGVHRLLAFGSVARGESRPDSDVDLVVEFDQPNRAPAQRFFGLLHCLEDALDCPVDLLTRDGLKNPYVMQRVASEGVVVYEG
jgi:uncharacterized protein